MEIITFTNSKYETNYNKIIDPINEKIIIKDKASIKNQNFNLNSFKK
jgi:hypothetical protein